MEKIHISICTGTTCFVMGGSELMLLKEKLPADIKEFVEIEGKTCLGNCKKNNSLKAPFVEINGELMCKATIPSIINRIRELTKENIV